jgi:hypothetical protein
MDSDPQPSPPLSSGKAKRQQTLRVRVFWFMAGAVVNYLFISTPFNYLKIHTGMSLAAISACSVGLSTSFFFVWNYFINFRGNSRKRDALLRYVIAMIVMWAVSSTMLTVLKHCDFHLALSLGSFPIDLDIVATQFFIGGFKFLVYHRWVFPLTKQ